uniref:glucuronosyltransferase n=1 Tax=Panagrellus redivivus TaxID=6233 RepID=A0A7E4URZ0_PANRE
MSILNDCAVVGSIFSSSISRTRFLALLNMLNFKALKFLPKVPLLCIFLVISTIVQNGNAAKILLYTPSISPSHIVMSGRMADILIDAGHDVVLFIPEYDPAVTLNGTKKAKIWRMENISTAYLDGVEQFGPSVLKENYLSVRERLIFEDAIGDMCSAIMARHKDLDIIRDYKFDIVFTEMIDLCGLGIMRYLGIPIHIWHSTTPLHDTVSYLLGVPMPYSYVPSVEENFVGPKMTFSERAWNTYMHFVAMKCHYYGTDKATAAIRKYAGPNFPNVRDIAAESTLAFVNSDEFMDQARPILHKTVYIGGLGIHDVKPVAEPFLSILNQAEKGVILFSFGTIVPTTTLSHQLKTDIVNLFSEFDGYHFIVKIDKDDTEFAELANSAKNVITTSWMPQADILGHPKLKLFITHGGFNGLLETVIRGVPIVAVPYFADQFRNAKVAEHRGIGRVIEKQKLSKETLKTAIHAVLNDPKYSANSKRLSRLIKNKPFKPQEVFVKWVNFVAENGALPELTPEGAHMNFFTYFNLDVFIVAASIPLLIVGFIVFVVKKVFYRSTVTSSKKTD